MDNNNQNQNGQNPYAEVNAKVKESKAGIVLLLILIVFIAVVAVAIYKSTEKTSQSEGKPSTITQIVKVRPDVSMEQTLNGINFLVTANDNYDIVEVSYDLLNSSGTIYSSGKVNQTNLAKGGTYTLTKSFSLSDMLKCSSVQYRISYYK